MFWRGYGEMLARFGGPLNFRLFVMPTVVTAFAIRAGLRDAREGRLPGPWAFIVNPSERGWLFRSGLKDVGRIFVVAVALDTVYQLMVLRWVYPVQVLIVAVACAVVPFILFRGLTTLVARALRKDGQAARQ